MLGWGDAWPPANSKRNQWRDDARARAAREGVWADWRLAASFPNRSLVPVPEHYYTVHPFFFFSGSKPIYTPVEYRWSIRLYVQHVPGGDWS